MKSQDRYSDPAHCAFVEYLLKERWWIKHCMLVLKETEEEFDARDSVDACALYFGDSYSFPELFEQKTEYVVEHTKEKLIHGLKTEYSEQYVLFDVFKIDLAMIAEMLLDYRDDWENMTESQGENSQCLNPS